MIISGNGIVNEEKKPNNLNKWILRSIIILSIICVIIGGIILIIQATTRKIYVNNKLINPSESLFIIDKTDGSIYISIKDIAQYIDGYNAYNGDYYQKSENTNQSYIRSSDEISLYTFNSNIIYKTPISTQPDYETFTISEDVKKINDKLYTTPEGIELGYNISFSYDAEKDTIKIFTLKYLANYYNQIAMSKGYTGLSTDFKNQKAILYDLLVVSKPKLGAEKEEDLEYGVITINGLSKLDVKYDKLEFIETTQEFFITSLGKVGLSANDGKTKIQPLYDELKLLDKASKLYLAKSNSKFGVINNEGNIVIYLEYSKIGIDSSLYPSNDIKNSMFFFDNCIIVEQSGKTGVFDKSGNRIIPLYFDGSGYIAGTSKNVNANNLLIIPKYECFVFYKIDENNKNLKKYGIINSLGNQIAACEYDKIYSITSGGQDQYYLEKNGTTVNLEDYLKTKTNTQQIEEEVIQNVVNNQQTVNSINQVTQNQTGNTAGLIEQ